MERLQRLFSSVGGGPGASAGPQGDTPQVDTAEQVYISSLALLKMLKHGACTLRCVPRRLYPKPRPLCASAGRAGVPMEVMGLMLGEFVDDYTVKVVDVFAMPQARAQHTRRSHQVAVSSHSLFARACLLCLPALSVRA